MRTRRLLELSLVMLVPLPLRGQVSPWKIVLDDTATVRFGATAYDGTYYGRGEVFAASGEKILHFDLTLRASQSPNYRDFTELFFELTTVDFRKNPRYSWSDVQAGRVSARRWATDPNNPRNTRRGDLRLPRPEVVEELAVRDASQLVAVTQDETLKVSLELIGAEVGERNTWYRSLTVRVLVEQSP